jgi:acetyl esterase/lipase
MSKTLLLTLILFSTSLLAEEQSPIRLWPGAAPDEPANITSKKAPAETGADGVIRIPYVDTPEIIRYPAPADKATGTCILICPGGAYQKLAWNKEGTETATWLNTIGIEAVVLKYRVPRRDNANPHPWPLQDVQRAIRIVRSHAVDWKIAPDRIGVMGFSAGGHLAVMSSVAHDQTTYPPIDDIDKIDATPNFLTLIYPAYLGDIKKDPTSLDPIIKVDKNTPPTFIAITHDDADRSLYAALFYAELRRQNIPAELHIFQKGGHGYGMRPSDNPVSQWPKLLEAWLKNK